MMKILFIIIDGLGDKPISKLGNKTPLEAAKTPNMDFLAKNGICGLAQPFLFPGEKEPTSEGTHIALFGYKDHFLGRGFYEAVGVGIKMKKDDIAFRVNFGTVDKNFKILDRRAGRIEKTQDLIKALNKIKIKGVKFFVKKSLSHRAVLVISSKKHKLSEKVGEGDPYETGLKIKKIVPLNKTKEAKFTAEILNEYLKKAYQVLEEHPLNKKRKSQGFLVANYILIRRPGKMKAVPSFKKRYRLKAACIAGAGLYKGIAKVLGMDIKEIKGATGSIKTNFKNKVAAVKKAFTRYNFIFLHIKAVDIFSHDGDFQAKKRFIEKIDNAFKPLLDLKNTLIIITADHSTCTELKHHCKELIPILIYGKNKDSVLEFSEKACQKGKLGKIKQDRVMAKILSLEKLKSRKN